MPRPIDRVGVRALPGRFEASGAKRAVFDPWLQVPKALSLVAQPVAQSFRIRHFLETRQLHQLRLAVQMTEILQELCIIVLHEHKDAKENAWPAAEIVALSGHETIKKFVQSQAFESIHRHHKTGGRSSCDRCQLSCREESS